MKNILIAGSIMLGVVLLVFVGLVAYIYFVVFGNANRTIAKNVNVTNEWTEISVDPPVKPTYDHQAIYLRPVDFSADFNAKGFEIKLPDGRVVYPEVEIYDQQGEIFQLHHSGFNRARKDYVDFSPETRDNNYTALPKNRTFKTVRIRSDVPFVCESITWIDYSPS